MSTKLRRSALLVGAALIVAAFAAPTASAATQVRSAATNQLCSAVQPPIKPAEGLSAIPFLQATTHDYQSGGCLVHVKGSGSVAYWQPGDQNNCSYELDAHVGPDGWGYVDNIKFSNCTYTPTQACAGDRIIAPVEYNPTLFAGVKAFKYATAATDLHVGFCANIPNRSGNYWGFTSFDIGLIEGGTQVWTNQQTKQESGSWYHHTGSWSGWNKSQNLSITH